MHIMDNISSQDKLQYCSYYQAKVNRSDAWFLVAILKSCDHMVFDRTIDKAQNIFEFFVPRSLESYFLTIMDYFISHNIVYDLKKLPNRLMQSGEQV